MLKGIVNPYNLSSQVSEGHVRDAFGHCPNNGGRSQARKTDCCKTLHPGEGDISSILFCNPHQPVILLRGNG